VSIIGYRLRGNNESGSSRDHVISSGSITGRLLVCSIDSTVSLTSVSEASYRVASVRWVVGVYNPSKLRGTGSGRTVLGYGRPGKEKTAVGRKGLITNNSPPRDMGNSSQNCEI